MSSKVQTALRHIATELDAELGPVADATNSCKVRLESNGDISTFDLDEHPHDALHGFVVPDGWPMFGIVTHGTIVHSETDQQLRCRCIVLGTHTGVTHTAVHLDGDQLRHGLVADELLLDNVLRCFGLDTPEPTDADFRLVPAILLLSSVAALGDARPVTDADVARLIAELPQPATWGDLRWAAIEGSIEVPLDATLCAWLDNGSFARTLLREADPTQGRLLGLVKTACDPDAWHAALRYCFDYLGLAA